MPKLKPPPAWSSRVQVVGSLHALFNTGFNPYRNCILLHRPIRGDFNRLALDLRAENDTFDRVKLAKFAVRNPHYKREADLILADIESLTQAGFAASLRAVDAQRYDEGILGFHDDAGLRRALSCYTDPVTVGARYEDVRHIVANRYDLIEGSPTFQFEVGDISVHAGNADKYVLPYIHKAPEMKPDDPPRLVLAGV